MFACVLEDGAALAAQVLLPLPVSDPDVSRPCLICEARFLEADRREIALRRGRHNRLGFAYQVAFVRVLGRWKNVILYGEIKIDPATLKMRDPY